MGNGNSSEKELQTSVLGCLNKIICSLDKSLFHAAVNLIQCNMCGCMETLTATLILFLGCLLKTGLDYIMGISIQLSFSH